MMILDTVSRSLTVVLGGAANSVQPQFVVSYVDVAAPDFYSPGAEHGVTNDTTPVELLSAPAAGIVRQLKFASIFNADDMAVEVIVGYLDNVTTRIACSITLAVGSTLMYTDGEGFRVLDANGNILVTANP